MHRERKKRGEREPMYAHAVVGSIHMLPMRTGEFLEENPSNHRTKPKMCLEDFKQYIKSLIF